MEPKQLRVLVVDDNRSAADALARVLRKQGDEVRVVYDGVAAIEQLESSPPDVVLTDMKMEPLDGLAVLKAARSHRPPVEVIVFTAYGSVDIAVKAMRLGARDFLTKPVTVDQVRVRLNRLRSAASPVAIRPDAGIVFVAESESSRTLLDLLHSAADVPSPVWLEGEIGSGRGHAALTLHQLGKGDAPFTVIDLGREIEWPESGTVLLPNVDDLPDDLQRRLTRALQQVPHRCGPSRLQARTGGDGWQTARSVQSCTTRSRWWW